MNTADYLLADPDGAGLARPALMTSERSTSYLELRQAAAQMLQTLQHLGIQPGDQVGLLGANSIFWVASYLAILKLGAVVVPLAAVASPEEWKRNLAFAQCKVVCVEQRSKPKLVGLLPTGLSLLDERALEQDHAPVWPQTDAAFDENRAAAIMFTSGTTAQPRGVRITHRNLQANTNSIIADLALTNDERMLVVLPFYYCFGLSLLNTHLRVGASLVLCNSFAFPETVLDTLDKLSCTGFAGVPSTFQMLLRNSTYPQRQFKTLRRIQQAGGKLPNVLIDELIAATPHATLHVMYGQTEATARLSSLPPQFLSAKRGSIGKGIPGVTLRVVNDMGDDVQPGETGEILAQGASISSGYLDDAEATEQKFVAGALRTGDLATVDEDGFIYIVDRKSDFIKSFGYRISSQQIEACVMELADVVSAAAIGKPNEVSGEAVEVFVVLRDGAQLQPEQIVTHCAQRLPRYMLPHNVFVLDKLPLNSSGKVVKSELKKLCAESPVSSI